MNRCFTLSSFVLVATTTAAIAAEPFQPQTRVAIAGGKWRLNGEVTYRGSKAEGLLMNVRMVNSTF